MAGGRTFVQPRVVLREFVVRVTFSTGQGSFNLDGRSLAFRPSSLSGLVSGPTPGFRPWRVLPNEGVAVGLYDGSAGPEGAVEGERDVHRIVSEPQALAAVMASLNFALATMPEDWVWARCFREFRNALSPHVADETLLPPMSRGPVAPGGPER